MKKPLAVAIDLDDTLFSFLGPFLDSYNTTYDDYVSLSDLKEYDFTKKSMNTYLKKLEKRHFYKTLPATYGAFTFVNKLNSLGIRIVIITARPPEYRSDTVEALEENNLFYDDLIFDKNKHQIINNLKVKYDMMAFIDDRYSTVLKVAEVCGLPFNFLINKAHNTSIVVKDSRITRIDYIMDCWTKMSTTVMGIKDEQK